MLTFDGRRRASGRLGLLALTLAVAIGISGATPLEQDPDLTRTGVGLDFIARGTGLESLDGGTALIQVDIGGPIEQAWLYWAGRVFFGNALTDQDQELLFDGVPITGEIVGTEFQPNPGEGDRINVGYRADVTSIVQAAGPGMQAFSVADGDLSSNLDRLNGATLIVYFTDESDPQTYSVLGYDGLDFAFAPEPLAMNQATVPVAIMFGAEDADRTGKLLYSVGDADPAREDAVTVSDNPPLINFLDGNDGPSWDSDNRTVFIPAFVDQLVVEVVSPAGGDDPDSLLWVLTALRLPVNEPFCGDGQVNQPDEECDDGNTIDGDGCSSTCMIEMDGGQGCTPGYWRNHLDDWVGFGPDMSYDAVFGVMSTFPAHTLLQVAQQGGGGEIALGRHAVAALLNAANGGVSYAYSVSDVIGIVQDAYDSGEFGDAKNLLESANEEGCPLGNGHGDDGSDDDSSDDHDGDDGSDDDSSDDDSSDDDSSDDDSSDDHDGDHGSDDDSSDDHDGDHGSDDHSSDDDHPGDGHGNGGGNRGHVFDDSVVERRSGQRPVGEQPAAPKQLERRD